MKQRRGEEIKNGRSRAGDSSPRGTGSRVITEFEVRGEVVRLLRSGRIGKHFFARRIDQTLLKKRGGPQEEVTKSFLERSKNRALFPLIALGKKRQKGQK